MNKAIFFRMIFLLLVTLDSTAMNMYEQHVEDSIHKIKEMGAWPDVELAEDMSLDEEIVTNCSAFWRQIKQNRINNGSLNEQDQQQIKTLWCQCPDKMYNLHRLNVAAALYLGINPNYEWMEYSLGCFILHNDAALVALALEKGMDFDEELIFKAKTVEVAEVLHLNGANFNIVTKYFQETVLHKVFYKGYDLKLIPYYIQHGVNPLQPQRDGCTPLHWSLMYRRPDTSRKEIIDRIVAFLEAGVSQNDIVTAGRQVNPAYIADFPSGITEAIELYHKNKAIMS